MKLIKTIVRKINLFSSVPEDDLQQAAAAGDIKLFTAEKDSYFLCQGDPFTELHILMKGICVAEMGDASGKVLQIDEFKAVHFIGTGFLFQGNERLPVSVKAKTAVEILTLRKPYLLKLLQTYPAVLTGFLGSLSSKINFLTRRLSFLSLNTIKEKIAWYLLTLPASGSGEVVIPVKMEELANYFGVARPSLSQVFIDLASQGVIRKEKKRIMIMDRKKLEKIIGQDSSFNPQLSP